MTESETPNLPRVATGIEGLEAILNGGLIPRRIYLIEGNPGAGKTTLSMQFLLEGKRRGEKCLYVTLSETREELNATAASHGWSLDGIEIVDLIDSDEELTGQAQVTMYHPSEVELSQTTQKILAAIERVNPQRIVFDSLSEMRLLAQNPLRYRRQVLALKQFLAGRNCTVLLLDDGTSDGSDLQIQSITHGVITLEQLALLYGAARRRLRVIKCRGTAFSAGYHDFVIVRGGLNVFPRLIAADHDQPFQPENIKSGITTLDSLLGGGPDRGTSTLLIGPAGCGKSTIAIQYAVAAAQRGDHAAVFAFDESIATLRARTASLGIDLSSCMKSGQIQVQQVDPAELSPGEFAFRIREAVEKRGARVVVIDSLNGYMHSMPEERFITAQLHELLSYLGRQGVTTLMVVAQQGMIGSRMQAPVDSSYLADSVVLLRYFEYAGKVKKAISVLKKRSGAHEESIRELTFNSKGIHLSEPLTRFRGILTGVPVELSGNSENTSGETRA